MKSVSQIVVPQFFSEARKLRGEFEKRFSNPLGGGGERFVWDYWHIPEQYTLLRTPAYLFFQKQLYRRFHERLVNWGRETLGCHDVTPTWMSCYVEGCRQNLHADVPHGPWAFVYSLTPWEARAFTGGETFLLTDEVLNRWSPESAGRALESVQAHRLIAPRFNQLTVFDPRIPHGVREVRGVNDVRDGRLVIHGWFVNPRPFIRGALTPRELQSRIDGMSENFARAGLFGEGAHGVLSFRFAVSPSGHVGAPKVLSHTLRSFGRDELEVQKGIRQISKWIGEWDFPKKRSGSVVTLPLQFA